MARRGASRQSVDFVNIIRTCRFDVVGAEPPTFGFGTTTTTTTATTIATATTTTAAKVVDNPAEDDDIWIGVSLSIVRDSFGQHSLDSG